MATAPAGSVAKVQLEQGGQSYAIACLREGGQEFCSLDLFLDSSDAKFAVKGKATVHLTGYFEADEAEDGDDADMPPASGAKASPKTSPKTAPAAKSPAVKAASPAVKAAKKVEDDDDDEDDEDEESE